VHAALTLLKARIRPTLIHGAGSPAPAGKAPDDFFSGVADDDPDFFDKLPDEVRPCGSLGGGLTLYACTSILSH